MRAEPLCIVSFDPIMKNLCEMCPDHSAKPATFFCPADACYLCDACDDVVHSANRLASRHVRRPVSHDELDGSSINDESDIGLVPDVTMPDSRAEVSTQLLDLPSFDDAAEYDFGSFDIGAKMPALSAIDDDAMWNDRMGKNIDFSWESVVGESIEHIVPDVERDIKMKPIKAEVRVASVSSTQCKPVKVKVEQAVQKDDIVLVKEQVIEESKADSHVTDPGVDLSQGGDSESQIEDEEAKALERRKKRRMEALARFRSKRANRSFTKKVRYECRKQLADSRPRVKGRFVRKVEMALFRKYGNLYREHLDELKDVNSNQCVSSL